MMAQMDFEFYRDLLQKNSGIHLTPDKEYLLTTRITPLCKTLGYADLDEYTRHLRSKPEPVSIAAVVDAMTTNETSFFRDGKPFQHLKSDILTRLIEARAETKKLRIWSAACSTGQEAYSIAMTLNEMGDKLAGWSIEILGTDIADHVLQKARSGEYNNFEIQRGLPMPMTVKYFTQKNGQWVIKDELRRRTDFKKFNLLENPARLGVFDIIFCRNVLIYFNQETKLQVLKNIRSVMAADGMLLLGSCENVLSDKSGFRPVENMHGCYMRGA
jgi:chemotaxis protein methyltransferase CheR